MMRVLALVVALVLTQAGPAGGAVHRMTFNPHARLDVSRVHDLHDRRPA